MKKIFVALSVLVTLFASNGCIRDTVCKDKTVESDQAAIIGYAATQGISATAHSSGLYYQVTAPGSGPAPVSGSQISIKYTGKLLDGTIFDDQSTNPVVYALNGMIQGFQIGLKLIQKGGKIKLIVPSALAYGCNGFGSVPGNSILYFEVELIDVL